MNDYDGVIIDTQKANQIFENMSDGVIIIDSDGLISYMNSSCAEILQLDMEGDLGKSFQGLVLKNRKNKMFNSYFTNATHSNKDENEKKVFKYTAPDGRVSHVSIEISLVRKFHNRRKEPFQGMMVLLEDVTDRYKLRQQQHDCAYIFTGIITCISIYLALWSLFQYTLKRNLSSSYYTTMIEVMTFILFVMILCMTSFSMKDIGIIPNTKRFKKSAKETVILGAVVCGLLLASKLVCMLLKLPVKSYFIGGSITGCLHYLLTAFIQEFLARGVIQTNVKTLLQVRFQKALSIGIASLLFAIMHLPFGFYFLCGAFILGIGLGIVFERQKDMWGCFVLHWACGYLAMALFF
jgi:PAS domain S-box-containing protein